MRGIRLRREVAALAASTALAAMVAVPASTALAAAPTPVRLAAGGDHALVLSSTGQMFAFGQNRWGQLASPVNNGTEHPNPTPTPVTLPGAAGSVAQMAIGFNDSLVLTSTGQLFAFGGNLWGQLGTTVNVHTQTPNPTPVPVTLPGAEGPVTQIASGANQSLALTSAGQLYAWGRNRYGELGQTFDSGTEEPNPTPMLVSIPGATGPISQIVAGGSHSFVVTSTGQLFGFGRDRWGALGIPIGRGAPQENPVPVLLTLPGATGPVTQIAAGYTHTLVLTSTGQVFAFGRNHFGQLGNSVNIGTENPNPTPTLVTLPGAGGTVTQIAAGSGHSLVLTSTGQLYAFGSNMWGQLGVATNLGTRTPNPTPTLVRLPGAMGAVTQIAAGANNTLALTSTGQLFTFGRNKWGELGVPINAGTERPTMPTLATLP